MTLQELINDLNYILTKNPSAGNLPIYVIDSRSGTSDEIDSPGSIRILEGNYPDGSIQEDLNNGDQFYAFYVG